VEFGVVSAIKGPENLTVDPAANNHHICQRKTLEADPDLNHPDPEIAKRARKKAETNRKKM
jgi:hypothetical protein